jgi:hypothetical protein
MLYGPAGWPGRKLLRASKPFDALSLIEDHLMLRLRNLRATLIAVGLSGLSGTAFAQWIPEIPAQPSNLTQQRKLDPEFRKLNLHRKWFEAHRTSAPQRPQGSQ